MNAVIKEQRSVSEAPPVTQMLADFVASHASRGWSDAVEAEAHRTFMNWVGCAIGPSQHDSVTTALGAVMELSPAPQASLLGRAEYVDMSYAAMINGIRTVKVTAGVPGICALVSTSMMRPRRMGSAKAETANATLASASMPPILRSEPSWPRTRT